MSGSEHQLTNVGEDAHRKAAAVLQAAMIDKQFDFRPRGDLKFPFFQLPRELKDEVYRYLFVFPNMLIEAMAWKKCDPPVSSRSFWLSRYWDPKFHEREYCYVTYRFDFGRHSPVELDALLVCRQMFTEASSILYGENVFRFWAEVPVTSTTDVAAHFLAGLQPAVRAKIRRINLEIPAYIFQMVTLFVNYKAHDIHSTPLPIPQGFVTFTLDSNARLSAARWADDLKILLKSVAAPQVVAKSSEHVVSERQLQRLLHSAENNGRFLRGRNTSRSREEWEPPDMLRNLYFSFIATVEQKRPPEIAHPRTSPITEIVTAKDGEVVSSEYKGANGGWKIPVGYWPNSKPLGKIFFFEELSC